jgi:hypothetical protein
MVKATKANLEYTKDVIDEKLIMTSWTESQTLWSFLSWSQAGTEMHLGMPGSEVFTSGFLTVLRIHGMLRVKVF